MPILKLEPRVVEKDLRVYTEISLPLPPLGGKCWVLSSKGQFLLERGPGMLMVVNCTHSGSGTCEFFDGVPNESGLFAPRKINVREFGDITAPGESSRYGDKFHFVRNGRSLKRDNPTIMGAWMMNAGFFHGLTVRHYGGQSSLSCNASIVWMPYKRAAAAALAT